MTRLLMTADAVGGVWQYATELAAALRPLGVETVIAVMGPGQNDAASSRHPGLEPGARCLTPPPEEAEPRIKSGVTKGVGGPQIIHTDLPLDWLAGRADAVLAAGTAIAALAREVGADIVQLNSPTLAAAGGFGVPVVAVAHGCIGTWWRAARGTAPDAGHAWHGELMAAGLRAADAAVAPSAAFAETLRQAYDLPVAPRVVHNGRTPFVLPDAPPSDSVFTSGRLWDEVKNAALLDDVAALVGVPFLAAGPETGPQGEHVVLRHLRHLGTLDERGLAAQLAGQPIFVSAASFEPFGLSVLEAAQAGCPLILSDIDTFRELWAGAALFVAGRDAHGYADAVARIRGDADLRVHLADAARLRAARYTPAAMAGAMAGIHAELLGAPQRVAA